MVARKKYDHFGIEIGMWNQDNVVIEPLMTEVMRFLGIEPT